jgi:tyrosine-protein kinase Etk/Wzc
VRAEPAFREGGAPALGDLFDVWGRHWRFLALNVVLVTLLALGISLLLPKWYEGRAVLLPPTEDDLGESMVSQLMPRGLGGLKMPGAPTLSDVFVAVLKSRTVADRIVKRFGLVRRYNIPDAETAAKELSTHIKFRVGDEGTIGVIAEDRDPKTAADLANAYVEELDRFNKEARTTSAQRTRAFIEQRLEVAKRDLATAEDLLRDYQQRRKLPSLSPSERSSAEMGAQLMAQRSALEVRLQVLRQSLAENSEEVRRVREELSAVDRQVAALPAAGLDVARLWREVKVQEQIFELLTSQLEEARIRETRDTPTVQVLDRAEIPLHKSRPKRKIIVIVGFLVGLAGSLAATLLMERRRGGFSVA